MDEESAKVVGRMLHLGYRLRFFLCGVATSMIANATDGIMRGNEFSYWLVVVLSLLPLIPFFVALRWWKQACRETDELTLHITRDACVFAFCGLFGLFICIDLVRTGGVLRDFVWDQKSLHGAMSAMWVLGFGWSWWRYR